MPCNINKNNCGCKFNIKNFGVCDVSSIMLNGNDRTTLNWSEISVPEVFQVPEQKPDIEHLDQVYVEANINSAKLIETPFAYEIYQRQATTFEITTVTEILNSIDINLAPIIDAINAILNIPGLPAIPAVAALQEVLIALTTAAANLTNAITTALEELNIECIAATVVVGIIETVQASLTALQNVLNTLIDTLNVLADVTATIPIVGPLVAAAVESILNLISVVINTIFDILTALTDSILLIGNTSVLSLIPNAEGTCLSGRKLVIEGELKQKVVYTALVSSQSVHSIYKTIPFNAYIIVYPDFNGLTYVQDAVVIADPANPCETITVNGFSYNPNEIISVNLCEEFNTSVCIEDIFAYAIDERDIFKNVTLFLSAKPAGNCVA